MKHHLFSLLAAMTLSLASTHAGASGDADDIPELKPVPAEVFADDDC